MKETRRDFIKTITAGGVVSVALPSLGGFGKDKINPVELSVPDLSKEIKNKFNIIWITCDEMNTKAMSIYGNPFTHMPAAEQLANEGTVFNYSYVQMPKSVPSRCSMITGRYPHCEGHRTLMGKENYEPNKLVKNWDFTLTEKEPNLVKFLKDRGYKTCLLGKNHLVDWNLHKKWFDYTSQWDSVEWKNREIPYTNDCSEDMKHADFKGKIKEDYNYDQLDDSLCVNWSKEFLTANQNNPFFALIDIGLPHPPYAEYTKMPSYEIPLESIPVPLSQPIDKVPSVEKCKRTSYNLEHLSDHDRKVIRRSYYTMCEFADSKVKQIIDQLDQLGLKDKTLIIYSADHGDSNGERNCYEKWDTFFYDEITKVPLIMRLPNVIPKAKKVDNLVEFVDIVPSILDILGCDPELWVQGKSFMPLLQGKTKEHKQAVFSMGGVEKEATFRPDKEVKTPKQKVVIDFPQSMIRSKMIRTEKYKYIYRLQGDCELYDMINDKDELHNLAEKTQFLDVINELQQRLLRFTVEQETNYPLIHNLYC